MAKRLQSSSDSPSEESTSVIGADDETKDTKQSGPSRFDFFTLGFGVGIGIAILTDRMMGK